MNWVLDADISGFFDAIDRDCLMGLARLWFMSLRRRSRKTKLTWRRMYRLLRVRFPLPRIVHPYPQQRFAVMTRGRSPVP